MGLTCMNCGKEMKANKIIGLKKYFALLVIIIKTVESEKYLFIIYINSQMFLTHNLFTQDLHLVLSFTSLSTVSRDSLVSSIIRLLYCFYGYPLGFVLVKQLNTTEALLCGPDSEVCECIMFWISDMAGCNLIKTLLKKNILGDNIW